MSAGSAVADDTDTALAKLYSAGTFETIKNSSIALNVLFGDAEELGDALIDHDLQWLVRTFQVHPKHDIVACYYENVSKEKITRRAFRSLLALEMLDDFNQGLSDLAEQEKKSLNDLDKFGVCWHVRKLCWIFEKMIPDLQNTLAGSTFTDGTTVPRMDQGWMMKAKGQKFSVLQMREHYGVLAQFVFLREYFKK